LNRPRLGLTAGESSGQLGVWVSWHPGEYAIEIYRLMFAFISPYGRVKERRFTVTYSSPQKKPFQQFFELPPVFKELLEQKEGGNRSLITITAKTIDESPIDVTMRLTKLQKIYQGRASKPPSGLEKLKTVGPDEPAVMSLDFSELVERNTKINRLVAAAKAKEAKKAAAAKAAAKPPPSGGTATPEPAKPTPKIETPPETPKKAASAQAQDKPITVASQKE